MEHTGYNEQYDHSAPYDPEYEHQEPVDEDTYYEYTNTVHQDVHQQQQYHEAESYDESKGTHNQYQYQHQEQESYDDVGYHEAFQDTEDVYAQQNRYTESGHNLNENETQNENENESDSHFSFQRMPSIPPSDLLDPVIPTPGTNVLMDCTNEYFPSLSISPFVTQLKFAVMIKPFGDIEHVPSIEDDIDDDDSSDYEDWYQKEVRCRYCKGYINPYCKIKSINNFHAFICSLCNRSTEISEAFYDRIQHKEITAFNETICEYPAEMFKDTKVRGPTYVFALNMNRSMVESGAMNRIISTIKQLIEDQEQRHNFNDNELTKIAFLTYDRTLRFYQFKADRERPNVFVSLEENQSFLPIQSESMFLNIKTQKEQILSFLDLLPTLHPVPEDPNDDGSSLGTVLETAYAILKDTGGKVVAFNFGLPFSGKGRLQHRVTLHPSNIPEYMRMLKRTKPGSLYLDVGESMARKSIGVDLHVFTSKEQNYTDLSTIHSVCSMTAGNLFHYFKYNEHNHGSAMQNNVYFSLTRPSAWACKVRVRSTAGMMVTRICGNVKINGTNCVEGSVFHNDSTIAFQLEHTPNDKGIVRVESPRVCVQFACIYSNDCGERRLRICTRQFPVTPSYEDIFDGVNLPQLTSLVMKRAGQRTLGRDLNAGRLILAEYAMQISEIYCALIRKGKPLEVDEDIFMFGNSLQNLPLDTLAMMRSSALVDVRDGHRRIHVDERLNAMFNVMHLDATHLTHYLHPSLYRVDQILELDEDALLDENWLPDALPLTAQNVYEESVYLADNGEKFTFRIGTEVDPTIIDTFFELDEDGVYPIHLKEKEENEYVAKLRFIMEYLTHSFSYKYQSIEIMCSTTNDPKTRFFDDLFLTLDHSDSCLSLIEFEEVIRRRSVSRLHRKRNAPKDWDSPTNYKRERVSEH